MARGTACRPQILVQLRDESNSACSRLRHYERAIFEGKVKYCAIQIEPSNIQYPEVTDFNQRHRHLLYHQEWLLQRQYHLSRAFGEERAYYFIS